MKYPNLNEENKLWKKGYNVIGIDEAGRGPLAAAVVAAAVVVKSYKAPVVLKGVKDSKKLSSKQREEIFNILKRADWIEWGIGRVSEKVIDRINILEATKLAMKRAVSNLEKKHSPVNFLLIDGNFGINSDISQKSIIKADEKVFSCACAGIIAKVTRDKMMLNYHRKYPHYGFNRHKGYPTKFHKEMIKKYGFSKIHRKTFSC